MELPNDGTNELSKDGFDEIALRVIFQGRKGQIGPFSHIYDNTVNTVLIMSILS